MEPTSRGSIPRGSSGIRRGQVCRDPIWGPLQHNRALKKEIGRDIRFSKDKPSSFKAFLAPNKYFPPQGLNREVSSQFRDYQLDSNAGPWMSANGSRSGSPTHSAAMKRATTAHETTSSMYESKSPHYSQKIHHLGSVHDFHSEFKGDAIIDKDAHLNHDVVSYTHEHYDPHPSRDRVLRNRPRTQGASSMSGGRFTKDGGRGSPSRGRATSSQKFRVPETQNGMYIHKIGARRCYKVCAYVLNKDGLKDLFDVESGKPIKKSQGKGAGVNMNLELHDSKEGAHLECINTLLPRVLVQFDCWGMVHRRNGGAPCAIYECARYVKILENLGEPISLSLSLSLSLSVCVCMYVRVVCNARCSLFVVRMFSLVSSILHFTHKCHHLRRGITRLIYHLFLMLSYII